MTPEAAASIDIRTILVPVDFSSGSDRAYGYAVRMARAFGARLFLLHVFDTRIIENVFHIHQLNEDDVRREMAEAAETSFAALSQRPESQGLEVERLSRDGIPAREIIRAAREVSADLVVIGAHGATGLREILYGTTAEGVVRGAHCPVLSVGDGRGKTGDVDA